MRTRPIGPGLALAAILLLAGCGSSSAGGTSAGGSSSEPSGFPSDFPVYSAANLQTSSTSGHLSATWTTTDSLSTVSAYYKAQLSQGDWKIQDTAGDTYDFVRKSDGTYGGTVSITSTGGKTQVTDKMGKGCPC